MKPRMARQLIGVEKDDTSDESIPLTLVNLEFYLQIDLIDHRLTKWGEGARAALVCAPWGSTEVVAAELVVVVVVIPHLLAWCQAEVAWVVPSGVGRCVHLHIRGIHVYGAYRSDRSAGQISG